MSAGAARSRRRSRGILRSGSTDIAVPGPLRSTTPQEVAISAFRFVHAADLHLDSPLRSLALRDAGLAELVGNATRQAFVRIVDLCLNEQVDALVIAGDLYDGAQTSMKTARFLAHELRRLHEAGVRTFIIRGNHDALSKITRELTLPDSVKLFGARADAVELARPGERSIRVHGLSFAEPHAPESLLGRYQPPEQEAVNIGLMHTSLGGCEGHDDYAPCGLADLQRSGFDYWALGHIHRRSVVEGRTAVVMPGMPQGRDVNEAGPKSVTLVTIRDDRTIHLEERLTSVAEFARVEVDAGHCDEWPALVRAAGQALQAARTACRSPTLIARLRITGAAPLRWRLRRDLDLLKAELDEHALSLSGCAVEKLELELSDAAPEAGLPGDPLAELGQIIAAQVIDAPRFKAQAQEIADELRAQLPPECRALLGVDGAAAEAVLARFAREGAEEVLAALREPMRAEPA